MLLHHDLITFKRKGEDIGEIGNILRKRRRNRLISKGMTTMIDLRKTSRQITNKRVYLKEYREIPQGQSLTLHDLAGL